MNADPMHLDPLLNQLEHADLIRHLLEADSAYAFRHALTQETAYESLLQKKRREIHRGVAEAYERVYAGRLDEIAPLLAQHFAEAGDDVKTFEYATRAGDAAARVYANAEAIMHYSSALSVAAQVGANGEQLVHLFSRRGRALELSGRYDEAIANYTEMQTLAHQRRRSPSGGGERGLELAALIALATIRSTPTVAHDSVLADSLSQQALALARDTGDRQAEVRVLWNLQNLNFFSLTDLARAIEYGNEALTIARELGLDEQLAFILNDISRAYLSIGEMEQAKYAVDEARTLWKKLDNLPMLADNLASTAELYQYTGKLEQAVECSEQAIQLAKSIGNAWVQSYGSWIRSYVYFEHGESTHAIRMLERAIALAQQAGFAAILGAGRSDLAWMYASHGAFTRGIELAQEAVDRSRGLFAQFAPWSLATLTRIYTLQGDLVQAERTIEQARSNFTREDFVIFLAVPIVLAEAELAFARADYNRAISMIDPLAAKHRESYIHFQIADLLYLKGNSLLALNKLEEAHLAFSDAYGEAKLLGSRRMLWRILAVQAEIEKQRGNDVAATAYLAQAHETIDHIVAHLSDVQLRDSFLKLENVRAVMES